MCVVEEGECGSEKVRRKAACSGVAGELRARGGCARSVEKARGRKENPAARRHGRWESAKPILGKAHASHE